MEKSKIKKIGKIALDVLLYIFLAICAFVVIVTLLSKRGSDGAAEVFGYQMRVVVSESCPIPSLITDRGTFLLFAMLAQA